MILVRKIVGAVKRRTSDELSIRYAARFNPKLGCSQSGEDGIIEEICRRLGVEKGWFVEFGAWDGVLYSNTYALAQKGWNGVGIECDEAKVRELKENMKQYPGYISVCRRVSRDGENRLDAILAQTPIPKDFDLLCIDIDGNDYWIWESLRDYRPKVVVIEYNPWFAASEAKSMPFDDDRMWDGESGYYGASVAALDKLGKSKGYTLVAYTENLNLFFVKNELVGDRFEPVAVSQVPARRVKRPLDRARFVDV